MPIFNSYIKLPEGNPENTSKKNINVYEWSYSTVPTFSMEFLLRIFLRYPIFRPTSPGWVRLREDQSHWLMPQDKNVGLAASHKLILKLIPLTIQTIHIPLESTWHEHPVGKQLFVGLEDPRYIPDIHPRYPRISSPLEPWSFRHWGPSCPSFEAAVSKVQSP